MKKDLHPTSHLVVFIDSTCNEEFVTTSILSSDEIKEINGVPHKVLRVEISSGSHPFFTGKQMLVDTARRVEKFEARALKQSDTVAERKAKKAKREETKAKKVTKTKVVAKEIVQEDSK